MLMIVTGILLLLVVVFLQDVKHRSIWWFLPPMIFTGGIGLQYPDFRIMDGLYALLFIAFLTGFLFIYVYLRFGKPDVFKSYFGLGDLLILIALVPFFEFRQYILFFTLATLSSLVMHALVSLFRKQGSVPYAGYVSLVLTAHLCGVYFLRFSIFELVRV